MDLHLKDAFEKFVKQEKKFGDKYYTERIKLIWQEQFNQSITSRTRKLRYSKGVLSISIDSSSLKNDLFNNRKVIQDKLNAGLKQEIIRSIRLI